MLNLEPLHNNTQRLWRLPCSRLCEKSTARSALPTAVARNHINWYRFYRERNFSFWSTYNSDMHTVWPRCYRINYFSNNMFWLPQIFDWRLIRGSSFHFFFKNDSGWTLARKTNWRILEILWVEKILDENDLWGWSFPSCRITTFRIVSECFPVFTHSTITRTVGANRMVSRRFYTSWFDNGDYDTLKNREYRL